MTRDEIERELLLAQAGELSRRRRTRLHRRLAREPEWQREQAALDAILLEARGASGAEEPRGETMRAVRARIRAESARRQEREPRPSFAQLWQPALTYALLAVVLGGGLWYVVRHWEAPAPPVAATPHPADTVEIPEWVETDMEERLAALEADVALTQSELTLASAYEGATRESLDDLAASLLEGEGT